MVKSECLLVATFQNMLIDVSQSHRGYLTAFSWVLGHAEAFQGNPRTTQMITPTFVAVLRSAYTKIVSAELTMFDMSPWSSYSGPTREHLIVGVKVPLKRLCLRLGLVPPADTVDVPLALSPSSLRSDGFGTISNRSL